MNTAAATCLASWRKWVIWRMGPMGLGMAWCFALLCLVPKHQIWARHIYTHMLILSFSSVPFNASAASISLSFFNQQLSISDWFELKGGLPIAAHCVGQELGVDGIVLSPVVDQMPHGYHGYWTKDLTKVNPAYGTEDGTLLLSHWNWWIPAVPLFILNSPIETPIYIW